MNVDKDYVIVQMLLDVYYGIWDDQSWDKRDPRDTRIVAGLGRREK